jgi:catalase
MQMQIPKGRVSYEPSSLDPSSARESAVGFRSAAVTDEGSKGRVRPESFADHYSQGRMFYLSQTAYEQAHIASALVFELSKVETLPIRQALVAHLLNIDANLGQRVATGLGLASLPKPAPAAAKLQTMPVSPALQIIGKMKETLQGRQVGILIHQGSNAATIKRIQKAVLAAGGTCKLVAPRVGGIELSDKTSIAADGQLAGTPSVLFDAVAIVLSEAAAKALARESAAVDFVRDAFGHLKAIAADEGAQILLKAGGVARDPGVVDAGDAKAFIGAAKTRQWAREAKLRSLA